MPTLLSIRIEPTERSMSPIEMTKTIPTAMIPNQEACRVTLIRLVVCRNLSLANDRKTQIASSAPMTPISSIAMIRRTIPSGRANARGCIVPAVV